MKSSRKSYLKKKLYFFQMGVRSYLVQHLYLLDLLNNKDIWRWPPPVLVSLYHLLKKGEVSH